MLRVAVDIGGTFTDLVAQDEQGRVSVAKVLTTPLDHSEGVMSAIAKAGVDLHQTALFLHGSTIAINTVIERKGVKTALITTRGFRDVYEIGRSNRPDAYNLFFERPVPLVPRSLRREVTERMTARGEIHAPLNRAEAAAIVTELKNSGVQSIAVCLLHSYANPAHEEALGEIIASLYPDAYLTLSHRILREYREYERTSTTAVNAYVGPVVARYLGSLREHLRRQGFSGEVLVMQSGGGVMSLPTAVQMPVRMMESGPVAGVIGAAMIVNNALVNAILQEVVPDELRGRVVSIYMVALRSGMPIGSLVAGGLADVFSPTAIMVTNGAGLCAVAGALLLRKAGTMQKV